MKNALLSIASIIVLAAIAYVIIKGEEVLYDLAQL